MTPAIWIATRNPGKAREFTRALGGTTRVHTLAEIDADFEVVEDAPDFAGNAAKKARETADLLRRSGVDPRAIVLADDSGLCVDALDGRPGVASARWAGPQATDEQHVTKLLAEIEALGPVGRAARFVCALVAIRVDGLPFFATEETCEGRILTAPAGAGGFGYDPVFVPTEAPPGKEGASFAAMTLEEKDAVSHRGKALRKFVEHFRSRPAR